MRFWDLAEMRRCLAAHLHWYNHARTHHALGGLLVPADRYYGRTEEVMARMESGRERGCSAPAAKPLAHIFKGAGVLEVVENHDTDTFHTVYTVRFPGAIYVLHAFQKKSKRGIKTPQHEIDLIRLRYEQARADYERLLQGRRGRGP